MAAGCNVQCRTQIVNGYDYSYATPKRTSDFLHPHLSHSALVQTCSYVKTWMCS
jgi:hypothetical protein